MSHSTLSQRVTMDLPSSDYVKDNVAVVHVFFEKQGFLKQIRGKIYDELVSVGYKRGQVPIADKLTESLVVL